MHRELIIQAKFVVMYVPSHTNFYNGMYPYFRQLTAAPVIFLSGEEGEIVGEICILDYFDMVLEALNS